MSSREQFEAWLSSEYQWANDALNEAHFHGDDATGYYTGGDFIYDGRSCSDALFWAWRGWQESHQQGEAKCAALAAELKQSQIDAGCYKKGMEASNERLVQVAAENAGLNEKMNKLATWPGIEFYSSAWEFNRGDGDTAIEFMCDTETPATESFLAEAKASAVDEACLKISNAIINCYQDEQVGLDAAATICGDFAAKLRQEAAQ